MEAAERNHEEDLALQRVASFIRVMLPIAIAFDAIYVVTAALLRNASLVGGAFAVGLYVVALFLARSRAASGHPRQAAQITGYALLVMVVVGAGTVHFLFAALVTMPVAAVAVVLPFLSGRRLRNFLMAAFLTEAGVVVLAGALPPLFEQPPRWFTLPVTGVAVLASCALTIRLLWIDSRRLRAALSHQKEAVRVRDDFLAVAGHELRTPLTTLMLQLDRPTGFTDATRARALRQVQRLSSLVEDLLDATRVSSGRLELDRQPMDLAAVIARSSDEATELLAQAGCELRISAPSSPVLGVWDAKRLIQVMSNLLTNAAKYGAGKPVELRSGTEGAHAWVSIQDHGIGLDASERQRIFERYERAVSSRNYGGFGLGLWIARAIIEAHGGSITVDSEKGRGAIFKVTLPREVPVEPARPSPAR